MGKLFRFALGLFLIGIGLLTVFAILSENDIIATVNEEDFVYNEIIYDGDDFVKLDFDFENRDFIFRTSENDEIKIAYYTTEKDTVDVIENGTTLEMVNDIKWYDALYLGWNFFTLDAYYDVYVYLPSTYDYELYLVDSNGSIDIMSMSNFDDIYVSTSNGKINFNGVGADSMELISSNGEARITDVTVVEALEVTTSNGRIYLTDVEAGSVDAYTSNGKIIVVGLLTTEVDLDTSNGDIEIELIGSVEDFEIYMSTSNGDLTYDGLSTSDNHINDDGQYVVHLNTSNGDVVVSFAD